MNGGSDPVVEPSERLLVLERHVRRAIELIESLRRENGRLHEERVTLAAQIETLSAEVDALRREAEARLRLETEHWRLLEEREQLGFWETLGYHRRGDPWKEERYSGD